MSAARIDCLFVGLLRDYGQPTLDLSHEYVNLYTGLLEHPRLATRAFHPDLEAQRHGADGMRARFAQSVRSHPPDLLVHLPFTPELDVDLDAVAELTARGVCTVEWDSDSVWRFEDFIRPRLARYALFVTTDGGSLERYRAGGAEVHLGQWAVGSWYRGHAPEAPRPIGVSFVGRRHGRRKHVIAALRRGGVKLDCFGPGWTARRGLLPRLLGRGRNHGYVPYARVFEAIGSSRVSLNLSNTSVDRGSQMKGRHFEIPGLGACQVTTPTDGLETWFEPGKEIVVAEEGEPLREALRALARDPARARAIAQAGHRRTWAEHTWARRIDDLLARLGLA